jgi:probable F420-dependent oxidoreductase
MTATGKAQVQLSMGLTSFYAEDPGTWQRTFDIAKAADNAGVDRLVVSDHIVFGERMEEYSKPELGGQVGGKQPTGPDGHWLEPITLLSVIAGMTSRVRLGTNILVAALRRPVVLAKSLSTLDVLSGGRVDLGVGVGWQREEYVAAGLSFEGRGRLLDHTLEVCQALWRNQTASYQSSELSFDAIHQMPKPLQSGGVPIWVSGTINARTVSRLARFGTGWIPWGPDAADLTTSITRMKEAVDTAGGDATGLQVVGYLPVVRDANKDVDLGPTMEGLAPLVDAGVTDFRCAVKIPSDPTAAEEKLRALVGAFRAAAGRPAP